MSRRFRSILKSIVASSTQISEAKQWSKADPSASTSARVMQNGHKGRRLKQNFLIPQRHGNLTTPISDFLCVIFLERVVSSDGLHEMLRLCTNIPGRWLQPEPIRRHLELADSNT
jgi:hypothetical protein